MPVAGLGSKPARLQRAAAAVPAHSHPYRFMGHRAPRSVEQRQTICRRWKLILEEVALVWNTFRKATTYVLAAKFNYGFYRQLLRIQKPMTIAKRQEMIETRSGIVTAPGPHAHEYQADPRRCPHPTPRRWGGKIGKFLLCDHCGAVWQLVSAPDEPETWEEKPPRPHPRAPILAKPKRGPNNKDKAKAKSRPSGPSSSNSVPAEGRPSSSASSRPSRRSSPLVASTQVLLSSAEEVSQEGSGTDWLMDDGL